MTYSRFRPVRTLLVAWFPLALFAVLGTGANALAQTATATLDGTVVDQSGAVLPGVTVTIANRVTGVSRSIVTDEAGLFSAPLLPVGTYDVTAELQGFATRKQSDVQLTIGQTLTLRIEMRVAAVAETVTVSAQTPIIETSRSQVSSTVGEAAVQNLPVNGRNFIDFALLTPGVTRDVRTGDISFAGQRGTLNSLVVDGADNNNTFFGQTLGRTGSGRAPYQFSQDAVKEFQVNSNAYAAEYGRAGGAVINVVTKSGTNQVSGTAFEFFRDKALNANDPINVLRRLPKGAYHYNQFGGNVGGPIRRDRHFFFVDYDGQRNNIPSPVFLNLPANTPSDAATQAAIAALQPLAFSWQRRQDQDVFLVKTDHQLSANHRVSLRYNHQNFTGRNFEAGGPGFPQVALEATGDSLVRTRTFNASVTSVLRNTLFNEARVQYARDREPGLANSPNPQANIRQGGTLVLTIGRNSFSPRETTINRWQFADSVTLVRAAHRVKVGTDIQIDKILNYFPGNFFGVYNFNSLASFAGGRPTNAAGGESYVQAFPGPNTSGPETRPNITEVSVFAQDEWRVNRDVTLNAGVRYDLQNFAKPSVKNPDAQLLAAGIDTSFLRIDKNNWGPRIGVAWGPSGARYVARAGYGLFFGRTPSSLVGTAHSNNGINVQTLTFTGNTVPAYPNAFASPPAGGTAALPSILVVDRDFENPRVQQASGGFEIEIMRNTALSANYLFVKGDDLPRSIDINVGTLTQVPYTVAGTSQQLTYHRFAAGRPFTNFARVISFQSTAESKYNGLTIELNRRLADHLQWRVAYTLGKVTDTVPDATAVVPGSTGDDLKYASNPADFDADRAPGNNDQRHRLVVSGMADTNGLAERSASPMRTIVRGWTFSAIFTAASGQPYSARVGAVDLNNDGNRRNDRAPGTSRNQFRLPSQYSLDPRITRDIGVRGRKVQLIWEAFNLFNAENFSSVNDALYTVSGTTLTPTTTFGAPLSSAGPRIMQLAIKFMF